MSYFKNKNIIITGAASGIGKATALKLDKQGARLILVDCQEERLKEVQKQLLNESICCSIDLSDIERIEDTIKPIINEFGPVSGLVHCAGISDNRPIALFKHQVLHRVMLINFYSFFELVRVLSKKGMYDESGMNIVGISSVAAKVGVDAQTAYGASKGAMNGAMHSMAKELSSKNIRVNTVLPAGVDTPMIRKYYDLKTTVDSSTERTKSRQYLGLCQPEYVASVISFLLSDESKWITGSEIPIDGGYMA